MSGTQIVVTYAIIFTIVAVLRLFLAQTPVGRIAFSWMGPIPREKEVWSRYQLRWAIYSLDWLVQIAVLFVLLHGAFVLFPETQDHQLPWAFQFALALGGGMALLAFFAFLAKAAKAHYLGPNPTYQPPTDMEEQH